MATTTTRLDSPLPRTTDDARPRPRLALREMTGWEEEYVEAHLAEENTARLGNEILARCLVPPGQDPGAARDRVRGLLVAERDRELVTLRRLSLGAEVKSRVTCPDCGEDSDVDFMLDALPLDLDLPPPSLQILVPDVGEVVLRLPTAGDQEDLLDAGLATESERVTWLLARCLQRYGGRDEGFDPTFVRNLPVRVRSQLQGALEEALPRLDLEMAVTCSHCSAPIVAPFDVVDFFFRVEPSRTGPAS